MGRSSCPRMEIPGGGDLLRTLPPPELLSGGSPCPVTPAMHFDLRKVRNPPLNSGVQLLESARNRRSSSRDPGSKANVLILVQLCYQDLFIIMACLASYKNYCI